MAIVSKGRGSNDQYATSFTVSGSQDGVIWDPIKEDNGTVKIFQGSTDDTSNVTNKFKEPIFAKFVRVAIQEWYRHPVLKMELIGCAFNEHPGRCWEGEHGILEDVLPILHETTAPTNALCGIECHKYPSCESFMFAFHSNICQLYSSEVFNVTKGESTLTPEVYYTKCTIKTLLN
ncbi:neuropilin-1-like [Pecten maximus]|uniref:neuropilin-1-like n=1 Tax=Pecten maximus TaxID=6579 RepID=UPI001458325E|nr:neuropilin-1-like [Pecten maximus]